MKKIAIALLLLLVTPVYAGLYEDAETARHDAVLYHALAVNCANSLENAYTDVKAKQEYLHNEYSKWSYSKQVAYDSSFASFYPFILDAFTGIYDENGALDFLSDMTDAVTTMDNSWKNSQWQDVINNANTVNYYGDWYLAQDVARRSSIDTAWWYIEQFEKNYP